MRQRRLTVILLAISISLFAIVLGWVLGRRPEPKLPVEAETPALEPVPEGTGIVVDLYFPGNDLRLHAEKREIPEETDLKIHLTRILQELAAGPESVDLYPSIPEEMTVGWTHINAEQVVYIDLVPNAEGGRLAWGSGQEILSVYSIVNTVLLNIPEITSVILLRNGQQHPSFAGHLDTSRPLVVDNDLIAASIP